MCNRKKSGAHNLCDEAFAAFRIWSEKSTRLYRGVRIWIVDVLYFTVGQNRSTADIQLEVRCMMGPSHFIVALNHCTNAMTDNPTITGLLNGISILIL